MNMRFEYAEGGEGVNIRLEGPADDKQIVAVIKLLECSFGITPKNITTENDNLRIVFVPAKMSPSALKDQIVPMLLAGE